MPTIKVSFSDEQNHQTVHGKPFSCPACGAHGPARVDVSWMARRVWGMVVKCWDITSTWTCNACGQWVQRHFGVDEAPPALHRHGTLLFLGGLFGVPLLILLLWGTVAYLGGSKERQARAADESAMAALRQSAAEAVLLGKTRKAACKQEVDAAIAKALPSGLAGGRPQTTRALTVEQIHALPTYPPGKDRSRWGWVLGMPIACELGASSKSSAAVENGLDVYHDPAEASAYVKEYAAAAAAIAPPPRLVTFDSEAIALISSEGELVAFARGSVDGLVPPRR